MLLKQGTRGVLKTWKSLKFDNRKLNFVYIS